jgi:hypothetical protein
VVDGGACTLLGPEGPGNPALSGAGVMVSSGLHRSRLLLVGVGVLAVC